MWCSFLKPFIVSTRRSCVIGCYLVGAIPPLMGWASCVGDVMSPGAWIMSGLLYAWQFPHFNALSWNLRPDYSRAGYRMMAVTNPKLCRKTALRYTAALMGLCYLAPVFDVTKWWFALSTTPLNSYFLYLGVSLSRVFLALWKREKVNLTLCLFSSSLGISQTFG